jgi:hypothetical protein
MAGISWFACAQARVLRVKRIAGAAFVCATLALAACGGDEEATAAAENPSQNPPPSGNPPPPGGGNGAPTISGAPLTQVLQGQNYSFTPTASDPNGDNLTFTIANRPSWAAFSTSNGQLTGTPTAGDVRTYSNVRISVSDGTNTVSLPAFNITVVATATGSATLSWTPPTQNTDGSPVLLTGYRVYWGTQSGNYSNSTSIGPGVAAYVVDQLTPATWYFVVTATSVGGESAFSNEASKVIAQ